MSSSLKPAYAGFADGKVWKDAELPRPPAIIVRTPQTKEQLMETPVITLEPVRPDDMPAYVQRMQDSFVEV